MLRWGNEGERRGRRRRRRRKRKTGALKVIVPERKMSAESERERAGDVANGCKLIAVMWILIPINQGQCGLLCHRCTAGGKRWGRRNCSHRLANISFLPDVIGSVCIYIYIYRHIQYTHTHTH